MARPVIALLSDFGTQDHYVGTMKGVALGICPDATLVDISHQIPPQDIIAGALELAAAYAWFPPQTVFLTVVDPGVGSARRAIAVEAGPFRFVAPDNGLLSVVLEMTPQVRAVELTEARYQLRDVSRTFEGRDRFAPAAAWLAAGTDLGALGPPADALHRLVLPKPAVRGRIVEGEVLRIDRFGNLITNIDQSTCTAATGGADRLPPIVTVGDHGDVPLVTSYADSRPGTLCALFGSTNHLEIAVSNGNAAVTLNATRGTRVTCYHPRAYVEP